MTVISLATRKPISTTAISVGGVTYETPDHAGILAEANSEIPVAHIATPGGRPILGGVTLLWLDDDAGTRHFFLCDDAKGVYEHVPGECAEVWEKAVDLALSQSRYFDVARDERIPASAHTERSVECHD